jgi:hypothetical protein
MYRCQHLILVETPEEEFVDRFAEVWKRPTPEGIGGLLDDYIVLKQPHLPTICGKDAAIVEFRRLLRWLPDFHGIVEHAVCGRNMVTIQWQMIFPIDTERLKICAVDRFTLQNGLATERAAYFDTRPLHQAIKRNPRVWPGFLRYRCGRG